MTVFLDDQALFMGDPDHSADEERFVLLGLSAAGQRARLLDMLGGRPALDRPRATPTRGGRKARLR